MQNAAHWQVMHYYLQTIHQCSNQMLPSNTLNNLVAKMVDDDHKNWDLILPYILAAFRSTVHKSTGYTPNYLTLSREVNTAIDIAVTDKPSQQYKEINDYVDSLQNILYKAYGLVRQNLHNAVTVNKHKYYVGTWLEVFKEGDSSINVYAMQNEVGK